MGLRKMGRCKTEYNYNLRVTVRVDWRVQWGAVVDKVMNHRVPKKKKKKVDNILNKMQRCKHTVTDLILF